MACPHLDSVVLQPPTHARAVYREDCTQCFDSVDDPQGVDVCLQCFNGGCAGPNSHSVLHYATRAHPLALNVRRTPKKQARDEPPTKMTKIAIVAESEADKYDTELTAKCLDCRTILDSSSPKLAPVIDAVMRSNAFARQEEVKAWEQELTSCAHLTEMQQAESLGIEQSALSRCSHCELKENLWLCLVCGNLGCGRKQVGGVDGNSHALAHGTQTGHGVAVKLGSISSEGTADVYCYKCDEERIDDDLGRHLAHWGILLAEREKTEKSLTEMQIEQNLRWDFSMTTESGEDLQPLFGPGLTGLRNLGNSCYLASVCQCLFDMPSFQSRYNQPMDEMPKAEEPAADLETQLRKVADGLLSGRYSVAEMSDSAQSQHATLAHQRGLNPAMLKHLIGRGHPEFSTMRQQDAFELLQHIFKLVSRTRHSADNPDPTQPFRFQLEQRLQCLGCKKVKYSTSETDSIFIDVPLEMANGPQTGSDEVGVQVYKPVTLTACLDSFTAQEKVELKCPSCENKDGFTKRTLFKTFPKVLVMNARKMTVVNWVPCKVDVPIIVPDGPFSVDSYLSSGLQPSEEVLPDTEDTGALRFVPDATALALLEGMGFSQNRCTRALHATGNSDANIAMEWILAHMDDPNLDTPMDPESNLGDSLQEADPSKVETLGAMGFPLTQAERALSETAGDVERAVEWLFSHPGAADSSLDNDMSLSQAANSPGAGSAELPANFQLQSMVCHKGTSIHAGHYVAFIRKMIEGKLKWVLFNDEKVVEAHDFEEMRKFAYIYFFRRE